MEDSNEMPMDNEEREPQSLTNNDVSDFNPDLLDILQSLTETVQNFQNGSESAFRRLELRLQRMAMNATQSQSDSVVSDEKIAHALFDLDEAVNRFTNATESFAATIKTAQAEKLKEATNLFLSRIPVWKRWLLRGTYTDYLKAMENTEKEDETVQNFNVGVLLFRKRLNRLLSSVNIERIDVKGEPVDPEKMNVVQIVSCEEQPADTVVETVRPGYIMNGRVLRYAEVVANKLEKRF